MAGGNYILATVLSLNIRERRTLMAHPHHYFSLLSVASNLAFEKNYYFQLTDPGIIYAGVERRMCAIFMNLCILADILWISVPFASLFIRY